MERSPISRENIIENDELKAWVGNRSFHVALIIVLTITITVIH